MKRLVLLSFMMVCPSAPLLRAQGESAAPIQAPSRYELLGERVQKRIDSTDWLDGRVSAVVRHATLPIVILNREADRPAAIAQLTQIVTAAAALNTLGPDHRFATEIQLVGEKVDGTATAVVIRGTGDPTLSTLSTPRRDDIWKPLDAWAQMLRKRGIRKIDGPVIGDGLAFDEEAIPAGWPADLLGEADFPSIGALNFNHNTIELEWEAGKAPGSIPALKVFPDFDRYVFISNQVRVAEPLGLRGQWPFERHYRRNPEGNLIAATGNLRPRQNVTDRAAIDDPARFFAEAMRARLIRAKIEVTGPAASRRMMPDGRIPGKHVSLDIRFSPPLREILQTMIRDDRALEAEVVLKSLAAKNSDPDAVASSEAGIAIVDRFLQRMHLPGPAPHFTDGSGRSELNRMSAGALVEMTHQAEHNPAWGDHFVSLFPAPGESGILEKRFTNKSWLKKDPAIRAKTASGPGIEAAAGWLETKTGERLIFTIIIEGSRLPSAVVRNHLDSLVLELTR